MLAGMRQKVCEGSKQDKTHFLQEKRQPPHAFGSNEAWYCTILLKYFCMRVPDVTGV